MKDPAKLNQWAVFLSVLSMGAAAMAGFAFVMGEWVLFAGVVTGITLLQGDLILMVVTRGRRLEAAQLALRMAGDLRQHDTPTTIEQIANLAGQWKCEFCGTMNHDLRISCRDCGTSRRPVD